MTPRYCAACMAVSKVGKSDRTPRLRHGVRSALTFKECLALEVSLKLQSPHGKLVRIDTERHIVLYEYQPDRKWERPKEFLKGFSGYLHADGYDGYHSLPENITVVGCWAHMRRKFDEALKSLPEKDREGSGAMRGKRYCDRLFEIERSLADVDADKRHEKRNEVSKPVLDEFFRWAATLNALPKSLLGQAAGYAASQRVYLERFLLDGRLEISNNRAERAIKPFVIGRKNWLFSNTPNGAKTSSVIYSVIETAKENRLKPFEYLVFLLQGIPNATTGSIDDFLPWSDKIPCSCRGCQGSS